MPTTTLIDARQSRQPGIESIDDFFGGRVTHPYMATKAITQARAYEFAGDVLLVESETDDYVPHTTLMSYRAAFVCAHSLTHRIVDGADHALSSDRSQKAYSALLTAWVSEMVIGARLDRYPHHSPWYS